MTTVEFAEELPTDDALFPARKTWSLYVGFVSAGAIGSVGLLVAAGDVDRSFGYVFAVAFAQLVMFWWVHRVGALHLSAIALVGVPAIFGTLIMRFSGRPSDLILWVATGAHMAGYVLSAVLLEKAFRDTDAVRRRRRLIDFAVLWASGSAALLTFLAAGLGVSGSDYPRVYLMAVTGTGLAALALGLAWVEARWSWNAIAVLAAAALFPLLDFLRLWLMATRTPPGIADMFSFLPWVVIVAAVCNPGMQSIRSWGPARPPLSGKSVAATIGIAGGIGAIATIYGTVSESWWCVAAGVSVSVALCARTAVSVIDTHSALATARAVQREALTAREEERQEMGHLLHDGVLQQLAALRWASASASAAELDDRVEAAILASRELLTGIAKATPTWDEMGAAVDDLSRNMGSRLTWSVSINDSARATAGLDVAVWEIVSEGVANAEKHSRGSRGYVWVGERKGAVEVRIVDDGRGSSAARSDTGAGSGLRRLAAVASEMNGSLRASSNGTGTSLIARLPI